MNKRELITRVQRHMGIGATRDAAQAALNAVLDSILQTAAAESKAHISHLGTFEYQQHHKRNGKGLTVATPASPRHIRRLSFRPARSLKKQISNLPSNKADT